MVKAVRRCAQKEVQASLDGRLGELGGMDGPDEITLPRSRRAGRKKEGPGQLGERRIVSIRRGQKRGARVGVRQG